MGKGRVPGTKCFHMRWLILSKKSKILSLFLKNLSKIEKILSIECEG